MTTIRARLRKQVIERAKDRCEYCRLSQIGQEATFHIDHVVPRSADGATTFGNLALACVSCSLRKEARQSAVDPVTEKSVPLYSPRTDSWPENFAWNEDQVVGLTPVGRATITALQLNRPLILAVRREEMLRGRHPPV